MTAEINAYYSSCFYYELVYRHGNVNFTKWGVAELSAFYLFSKTSSSIVKTADLSIFIKNNTALTVIKNIFQTFANIGRNV